MYLCRDWSHSRNTHGDTEMPLLKKMIKLSSYTRTVHYQYIRSICCSIKSAALIMKRCDTQGPLIRVFIRNWQFYFDCGIEQINSPRYLLWINQRYRNVMLARTSTEFRQTRMEDPTQSQLSTVHAFSSCFFHISLPSSLRSAKLTFPLICYLFWGFNGGDYEECNLLGYKP
jgi:hypothetical protein